jgi:hypothetical protein
MEGNCVRLALGRERGGETIRKWGVSNYFFWKGIRVVAPETCLESRCLKRK